MIDKLQLQLRSFGYAFSGLLVAFKSQTNLQLHGLAAILVMLLGWYVTLNATEWCIILICCTLVISCELMNTAIETYIDYRSPEQHPEIGKAKDIAAAAVLVCAIVSAIIGCIIFIPKFL